MEKQLLYLSQDDVEAIGLSMAEIIDLLEVAFGEKGQGRVEMPPKPGIHPGDGDNFIHAVPAYIPAMNAAGVKWVSGYPENYRRDLPYITGLLILNDPETGVPLAVMDCVWITVPKYNATYTRSCADGTLSTSRLCANVSMSELAQCRYVGVACSERRPPTTINQQPGIHDTIHLRS